MTSPSAPPRPLPSRLARAGLCWLLAASAPALSAAGLRGRVLAADSGLYLEGARITVRETGQEVLSERGGEFLLPGLPEGSYTLDITYLGYPETVMEVVVPAGATAEITARLGAGLGDLPLVEMAPITVISSKTGQAKAFNQQQAADHLVNIIASDALGQFVDRNAAEAVQRVAGVSVQDSQGEGKFVIIRGADPALNSVQIDGIEAATPEADGRRTGLNIIAIEQLERIEVSKTWLPDSWGNFIGGRVDLVTRSALDREGAFAGADAAYGWYEIADEASYRASAYAGDSWGERFRVGLQVTASFSEDHRGSDTLSVDGWDPESKPELRNPPQGFVLRGLDLEDYDITRERTGLSAKLEWQFTPAHRWHLGYSHNRFDDNEVLQASDFDNDNGTNDYTGVKSLTPERAVQLGYDLNDPAVKKRLQPGLENNRLFFDEAVQLGGIAFDPESLLYTRINFSGSAAKRLTTTVTEDQIDTAQFGGRHQLGDRFTVDYRAYASEARQDERSRFLAFETGLVDYLVGLEEGRPIVRETGDRLADAARFRINKNYNLAGVAGLGATEDNTFASREERRGAEANLLASWEVGPVQATTKVGAAWNLREKSYEPRRLGYSVFNLGSDAYLTLADAPFAGGDRGAFLSEYGDYAFGPWFNPAAAESFLADPAAAVGLPEGFAVLTQNDDDITYSVNNALTGEFRSEEELTAGYLLQTFDWRRWRFLGGLRFERTSVEHSSRTVLTRRADLPEEIQSALPSSVTFVSPRLWRRLIPDFGLDSLLPLRPATTEYDDLLFALHAQRRLGASTVARAALTRTLARPEYTDLNANTVVASSGFSFAQSARLPSMDLAPFESLNADLSLEHYFRSFGVASVAAFYKDLTGAVYDETVSLPAGSDLSLALSQQYIANPADWNSANWSVSRPTNSGDGWLAGVEFSLEKRFDGLPMPFDGFGVAANFTYLDSAVELTTAGRVGEEVPLFRQSGRLANLSLLYERWGLLVRLSWMFRGKYLDGNVRGGDTVDDLRNLGLPDNALDVWVDDHERLDLLVEYRFRRWGAIFAEATNLRNEPLVRYFGSPERLASIRYTEPAYFFGARLSF